MPYPSYQYPTDALQAGSCFGNYFTFARLSADTDLKGLWSAIDNQFYIGEWKIRFVRAGKLLEPKETLFFPESQSTKYDDGSLRIEKRFFLPFSLDETSALRPSVLQSAHYVISASNASQEPVEAVIQHQIYFPGDSSELFLKQPSKDQLEKLVDSRQDGLRWVVSTRGKGQETRIVQLPFHCSLASANERMLFLEFSLHLAPGEKQEIPFQCAYSPDGEKEAGGICDQCRNSDAVLRETIAEYKSLLSRSEILTPDPVINRGLQWAKANTGRVQHRYRTGFGFTNDPPQDIVVIRDLAWYILGADYLTPRFSKELLAFAERYAYHQGGKLTEYLHADEDPPARHDYKLNINDDTPLFVYALFHHALVCRDEFSLAKIYPLMKRACDWILDQRAEDGLIRCNADGTNVWGICSWRNIIDNYNLTGAVTEINAECYCALKCLSEVAGKLGKKSEASQYRYQAETLRQAINTNLISAKHGMYLLNSGNDGADHHDVTGDLVFPAMFGVAEEMTRKKILARLTDEDMWTPYGSRTVSKQEENYDPDFGYQLVGGLWPNLTAWTAYCIREDQPEKMVEGMHNIYRLSEEAIPRNFGNVVPGEFPERLHGETFISRGMAMSPWMPPTYLWLGIEGLLGLMPESDEVVITPHLPDSWKWIAVKNLLYRGETITLFAYHGTLYSTHAVKSSMPVKVGRLLPIHRDGLFCIGMDIDGASILFIASEQAWEGTIDLQKGSQQTSVKLSLPPNSAILHLVTDSLTVEREEK